MRAFLHLLRWDFAIQFRSGFWIAAAVVTVAWTALLWPFSRDDLATWLPLVLYCDTAVIGMMFIAGILFVERRQGVHHALAVTPMSARIWLLSKFASLVFLATTVASLLTSILLGPTAPWPRLLPAFVLGSLLFSMIGFLVAARFRSFSTFLIVCGLSALPTTLPVLDFLAIWSHPSSWLNPFHAVLVAFAESFRPSSEERWAVAVVVLGGWVLLGQAFCERAFQRWVVPRPTPA